MNYQEVLNRAKKILLENGKEEVDARHLLFFLMNWTSKDYLEHGREEISAEKEALFFERLQQRCAGVPLQEIMGSQSFYGYDFGVSPDVLTPRPETELLVELALAELKDSAAPRVMDLCTGSGCIAITIAKERPDAVVTGVDISLKALEMAKRNAKRNQVEEITWIESDLFGGLTSKQFEMIISNPPYIPRQEIKDLEIEVREYDPVLALDGGEDGLDFYRAISKKAGKHLVEGGKLLLEIGHGQAEAVCRMLAVDGWTACRALRDYAHKERMIMAIWSQPKGDADA